MNSKGNIKNCPLFKEEECKQECMNFQIEIELGKNVQIPERWKFKGKWGIQI